jgi:hypothetical protein
VLVVLATIDVDVVGSVEVVTVEVDVVIEDTEAVEGVTTVVGVLADEQELMNKSAAIATPGRLNDRKGSLSPIDSRRGLTGLPPICGGPSKHTTFARRMCGVLSEIHIHPDKGQPRLADATTLSTEFQEPSNSIPEPSESMKPTPPYPNLPIQPFQQSVRKVFAKCSQSVRNPFNSAFRRTEGVIGGHAPAVTKKFCACRLSGSSWPFSQSQQG